MTLKLTLNRETLRCLDAQGLAYVAGAEQAQGSAGTCLPLTMTQCPSVTCPSDAARSCTCTTVQTSITNRTRPVDESVGR